MPRVTLPCGTYSKCDYRTTASQWRRCEESSSAHEAACKDVITDLILSLEDRILTGMISDDSFYRTLREELKERTAAVAQQPPEQGADN